MNPVARLAGVLGGLLGLGATATAAIGAHTLADGLSAQDLRRFVIALAFAFVHALLLVQIASLVRQGASGLLIGLAAAAIGLGSIVFCGSLLAAVFWATPTAAAPYGGMLLMLGWTLLAVWFALARR